MRDDRRRRLEQHRDVLIGVAGDARAARRAEGARPCVLTQAERSHGREERRVARVRPRPAALDVVHAEGVEALGDAQLVLERERDVLALAPVAQRRVVELDGRCRITSSPAAPRKASCSTRTASSAYLRVDHHRDLDLRGRDHLDVDAVVGERAEHLGRDAGVAAHAEPDDRHLGDVRRPCGRPRRRSRARAPPTSASA